jgi:hypothetical protein
VGTVPGLVLIGAGGVQIAGGARNIDVGAQMLATAGGKSGSGASPPAPKANPTTVAEQSAVAEGGGANGAKTGTAGGERAGKSFTPAGKRIVKEENAAANAGQTTCSNCKKPTIPGQQGKSGVTPPKNEAHVDHIIPKAKEGDGSPSNGQVLCRDCNLKKSDK